MHILCMCERASVCICMHILGEWSDGEGSGQMVRGVVRW